MRQLVGRQQGQHTRKLVKWQDLTLAIALIAACLGFLAVRAANARPATLAHIYLQDALIEELSLDSGDDYRIDLAGSHGVPVSFEVKDGAIRFVDVDCPDHLCERTGFVSTDGETAVCMPNRVAVVVSTQD